MVTYHGWGFGERLDGTDDPDALFGEGGDDDIFGAGGNDLLQGGEGDDEIFGGADNDVLVSGVRETRVIPPAPGDWPPIAKLDKPDGGDDDLHGGSGNDRLIVTTDSAHVLIDGGSGIDTLQIGLDDVAVATLLATGSPALQTAATVDLERGIGIYRFNGSIVALDLTIEDDVENVDGSAFNETISGTDGVNVLNGELGDDVLRGRGGADTIDGGDGIDTAVYDDSTAAVNVDLARAVQSGGDAQGDRLTGIESVTGSVFADTIRGNSAANILIGGAGNDSLEGRGGADRIEGGAGTDTASYESSQSANGVVVNLSSGSVQSGGDAEGDILVSIENVTGSMFSDTLTGNNAENVLRGGFSNDVLRGLDGDDTLEGGEGNDLLDGGGGIDTASFSDSAFGLQIILGRDSADGRVTQQFPGNDVDLLRSIESVVGSNFNDSFFGNEVANVFRGLAGDDYFLESRGNDSYIGDDGIDTLDLSTESSAVSVNLAVGGMTHAGTTERDTISSIERVVGTSFSDNIVGSAVSDFLFGGAGRDQLSGGGSDDLLVGGRGGDVVTGGSGADTFSFRSSEEIGSGSGGDLDFDLIRDFQAGADRIDLSAIDANPFVSGNQAFTFVNAFSGQAGQIRVVQGFFDGQDRPAVLIDTNGDAREDAFFFVNTANGLLPEASDFLL